MGGGGNSPDLWIGVGKAVAREAVVYLVMLAIALALYMVWPSQARSFDFDNVINSYTSAARAHDALICPAGRAWKYAWQSDAALPLYSSDRFHPSIYGSVLAALTIYGSLYEKKDFKFLKHSRSGWKEAIPADKMKLLEKAALLAMAD